MMICKTCQADISEDTKYCTECGTLVTKNNFLKNKKSLILLIPILILVISIPAYIVYQKLPIEYEVGGIIGEYVGDKKNGIPHGYGKWNGRDDLETRYFLFFYEGEWFEGKRHGTGTNSSISFGDKAEDNTTHIYVGDWVNDKRHGMGVSVLEMPAIGTIEYEGEWADNQKHGYGVETMEGVLNTIYSGNWKDGKKHGRGTEDCSFFGKQEGRWVNGKMDGLFKVTDTNGRVMNYMYSQGELLYIRR